MDDVQESINKKNYNGALYLMNEKFEKSVPNKEELERYSKIYNKGKNIFFQKMI
ncbi:hypothetical protein [Fusobacterium nucleatum]|uniref:hypothetical protein n=1 Tax=Fusobacterium nucleatum TaxID=851 RepID=UPI0030D61C70